MNEPADETDLHEVMTPTEHATPDHREHAKAPARLDDDELAERTEHERELARKDEEN